MHQRSTLSGKAVTPKTDYARLRSYLRASNLRIALLANFSKEKADFRRVEVGDWKTDA